MRFEILALLLLLGCIGDAGNNEKVQPGLPPSNQSSFFLPESPINYTAHYVVVSGDGGESYETVWREGKRMKVESYYNAERNPAFGFYFADGKVFFCMRTDKERCKDTTSLLEAKNMKTVYQIDLAGAIEAEKVPIGNTTGQCYILPSSTFFERRKVCLTDTGVLAYDELSYAGKKEYVKYLVELSYFIEGDPWKGEH